MASEVSVASPSAQLAIENPNGSPPGVDLTKKKKKRANNKFSDKYELTGVVLGKGESSEICECRDLRHQNLRAAKAVAKTTPGFDRDRILTEIRILTKCKAQETIIQLIEFYEDETCFTLIFEKISGGPLMQRIKAIRTFTERDASDVTNDIAHALDFLHSNGITHRDLKPDNILCVSLSTISPVKLADFDLSQFNDTKDPPRMRSPVGTPEFMSPEIADAIHSPDHQPYNELCDVWALGVILHMMLIGAMPFVGKCGADCGWDQGQPCERCADDLLENISACKQLSFDADEWQRITGGAKDLLSRMLVRATQRISAKQILEHPWVCQAPPMTPLATPARLLDSTDNGFNTFLSDANDKLRKMEADAPVNLGAPGNDLFRRRSQSRALLAPFSTVKGRALAEIHTPKFPIVSPPGPPGPPRRSTLSSSTFTMEDLDITN
eukprot:m.54782 g.54782  ORF g.54782 m.54782 type:complete len:439 (-) comp11921_c0_seq3:219-1535(-)